MISMTEVLRSPARGKDVEETVGFHMSKSMVTLQGTEPLLNACKVMSKYRIGCLPVLNGKALAGVVTDQALIRCAARGTHPRTEVRDVCTPALVLSPTQTIREAIERLRQQHAKYLLVAGKGGALQGLISQTDLLEASRRLLVRAEARFMRVRDLAARDPLTGLFTRRVFDQALADEFQRSRRYGGLLTLLLMDLDHFKRVNDDLGHAAGDLVLRRLGQIIRKHARRVDVPCRYGGDEMAVLIPECGTRAGRILGERIRAEMEQARLRHRGRGFRVTVSGGVCKRSVSFKEAQGLLEEADRRLYEAKRSGRNRIEVSP